MLSLTEPDDWHSTPANRLSEQLNNQFLDVSRRLERMKTDLGMQGGETADVAPCAPLPLFPGVDDVAGQRSPAPEALAPQDGCSQRRSTVSTEFKRPVISSGKSYPTLREERALEQFLANSSTSGQHPPPFAGREQAVRAPNLQPQGKKLSSGLSRRPHDRVVREVSWPHEFVFSATTAVNHETLTLDELVAGELAIILDPHTSHMESMNRGHILRGLMLDLPTYSFAGIKNFYKILWIHVEHGIVTIDSDTTISEVHKLKEDHLRRPSIDTVVPDDLL